LRTEGFMIWDLGFGIYDFGFGIYDLGFWIYDFGFWISLIIRQLNELNINFL